MAQNLNIQGSFPAGPGTVNINTLITIAAALGVTTAVALASGFNSIAVPAGATAVLIQLPTGNAVSVTLKGVTGDTGLALLPTGFNLFQLTAAQATIGLTAGGAIASLTYITFL